MDSVTLHLFIVNEKFQNYFALFVLEPRDIQQLRLPDPPPSSVSVWHVVPGKYPGQVHPVRVSPRCGLH